jgi:hypothetical protein
LKQENIINQDVDEEIHGHEVNHTPNASMQVILPVLTRRYKS